MSERRDPFALTTPCVQCPFRNDKPGFLTGARAEEIRRQVAGPAGGIFPCHKTVDYKDEGQPDQKNSAFCAGALILMEHEDAPNQAMRIAERLRFYDRRKLDMSAPVHKTWDEFVEANNVGDSDHRNPRARRGKLPRRGTRRR